MKKLALILCTAALALAQTTISRGEEHISAGTMNKVGSVTHLTGHVIIENDGILVRADAADFNESTGVCVAHGDVRIKLK
jgi:lipopolysaccharide assembly outer membrane protein LptD (OstA)